MRIRHILLAGVCCMAQSGFASAQTTSQLPSDNSPKAAPQAGTTDANGTPTQATVTTAAQPGSATAGNTATNTAGDIIVTAQRRDESLSRTPVAITVISADTLARANIVSEGDLRQAAPGLQVRSGISSSQLNYSLRGQSQDPFSNSRPGVLPYFNEVQISTLAGSSTFYDLQSVQVLKGPQGTLFGRSATGGAILFTTAKPTDKLGGYVSGLYGNYDQFKLEGALNLPLSGDQLMLRVAGFFRGRDGFQRNLFTGGREGRQRQFGVRPSLTAQFGPSVRNELVVDYFESNSENTVAVISGLLPFTGTGAPFVPAQFLYAGNATPAASFTGQCTIQAFAGFPGTCPPVNPLVSGFYSQYYSDPRRPSGGIGQVLADQNARGPFVIATDGENIADTRNTVVTNATSFDVGDKTTIKNIFGYVNIVASFSFDADGTPYGLSSTGPKGAGVGIRNPVKQFSDELQLVGTTLGSKLDYVLGAFYSNEKNTYTQNLQFFDIVLGGQRQTNSYRITNDTYAGYAQGTYAIGDSGVSFTAGGRYTREKVRKQTLPGDSFRVALGEIPPAGFDYDQERTFNRFSWTLGAQYQLSASTLLYVKNRRAYKSGGFNGTVAPVVGSAAVGGDGYDAERVTDVEVGAKFNGFVGSMPARFALAGFHNWIDGSQRAGFGLVGGGPASVTVNVPKGKTYGAEVEGQIKPASWLTVGGNFNYTKAKFTVGQVTVVGVPQVFDRVSDTPKYTASGFADVTVPLSGSISALAHGDVYYQSESFTSPRTANFAGTRMIPYTVANFRLGVQDESAGWSLTANLKNAFDKTYYVGGLQVGEIYQVNTLIPGDPRTYTLEARFKF